MDKKLKHLEMIQGVISRMASNSFILKGGTVTLVAAIFTFGSNMADKPYYLAAFLPVIVFWGMDAYYLMQERLFRSLYDKVRNLDENNVDFSMNTAEFAFRSGSNHKNSYFNCLLSKTVLWFYFPLALISATIIVITCL